MLQIALDALILIALIKVVSDDDLGCLPAFGIAFVAAVGTTFLAAGLAFALGLTGLLLGALSGGALLGVVVSAMFGIEIRRAMMVGGIFVAAHIGISFLMQMMLSTRVNDLPIS